MKIKSRIIKVDTVLVVKCILRLGCVSHCVVNISSDVLIWRASNKNKIKSTLNYESLDAAVFDNKTDYYDRKALYSFSDHP